MPRYRFDFLCTDGEVLATHEIEYVNDEAAVASGHLINGDPPIGCCFKVWRDGELIHLHVNAPSSSSVVPIKSGQRPSPARARGLALNRAWTRRATLWWLAASAIWMAGYLFGEALDGLMFQELSEVIPVTILPPLLLAVTLWGALQTRPS